MTEFSDQQLQAYLDEALPSEQMAQIEATLRGDAILRERLTSVLAAREGGIHSLGEIWRRHRISCPSREQLGSYLLGAIDRDQAEYIRFHLEVVQCRYCGANLDDLRQQNNQQPATANRRRRYFETSAGYLSRNQ